ncbi:hypothetical protein ABBQ32_003174 [Trebouxia sp. C0010 RCD-2024]
MENERRKTAPRRSGRLKHLPGPCVSEATDGTELNKKGITIDCLPDVLLLQVLASTKSNGLARRQVLPLVCKKWRALLQGPSLLWEEIVLDFCDKEKSYQRLLRTAIQTWLKPRASSIKSLTLKNSSIDPTHTFAREGSPLAALFCIVAPSLTSLQVVNCNDIFNQSALEDLKLFTQLTKLHIVDIRHRYPTYSYDSLSSLTSLQDIRIAMDTDYESVLTTSCLSALPSALLALTRLTSLSLASQGLTDIPDGVSALSNLEILRLDNCKGMKNIPARLSSLKSLRELSLDDTTGFPLVDSIRNLKLDKLSLRRSGVHQAGCAGFEYCSIKHLDVAHNTFASNAPAVLDKYRSLGLEVLNFNSCEMDTVPGQLYGFHSLKVLNLGNNGLVELPECVSCLLRLECLLLQGNCFPKLPQVIQKLKNLYCLSLVACNYLEVPGYDTVSFFAKWPRLTAIWMWKTEGVEYQDYSKDALHQLLLKLKRKRHRPHLLYEGTDASTDLQATLGPKSLVTVDIMLP